MALPEVLYAMLETGIQVKIVGAITETRKEILVFDKQVYRDAPPQTGSGAGVQVNDASLNVNGGTTATITTPGGFTGSTINSPSSVLQDDNFTHIPMRLVPKLDTLVEFWGEGIPGKAMHIAATVVSGSGTITVPNSRLLTPGQGISGNSIPSDTIILSILAFNNTTGLINTTDVIMSNAATASGNTTAIVTGGADKVGEFLESQFIGWGSEISTPM